MQKKKQTNKKPSKISFIVLVPLVTFLASILVQAEMKETVWYHYWCITSERGVLF